MRVVHSREEMRSARPEAGRAGFVPTMGFLHEGHLSLVARAKAECDAVVVSIFVNPTQFGPGEDLEAYPRDLDRDLSLLEQAGVDVVWTPRREDVYPPGFATSVDVDGLTAPLEGSRRPGHFRGVATVVTVLLNVVRPDAVYVGQKDAQQAAVLNRMVADLGFGADVVVVPTVREPDGLALSSRNTYLSEPERSAARCLSQALRRVESAWHAGERDADTLRRLGTEIIEAEDFATCCYFSVADPDTLAEVPEASALDPRRGALVSTAVVIGLRPGAPTLIDNVILIPR